MRAMLGIAPATEVVGRPRCHQRMRRAPHYHTCSLSAPLSLLAPPRPLSASTAPDNSEPDDRAMSGPARATDVAATPRCHQQIPRLPLSPALSPSAPRLLTDSPSPLLSLDRARTTTSRTTAPCRGQRALQTSQRRRDATSGFPVFPSPPPSPLPPHDSYPPRPLLSPPSAYLHLNLALVESGHLLAATFVTSSTLCR